MQLMWNVARQLEALLGEQHRGLAAGSSLGVAIKESGIVAGAPDMDEKLAQYVLACTVEAKKHHVHFMGTDKASPASLAMQSSTLTFGNNTSIVLCPMVSEWPTLPERTEPPLIA